MVYYKQREASENGGARHYNKKFDKNQFSGARVIDGSLRTTFV
jgi:hypothetical protein